MRAPPNPLVVILSEIDHARARHTELRTRTTSTPEELAEATADLARLEQAFVQVIEYQYGRDA